MQQGKENQQPHINQPRIMNMPPPVARQPPMNPSIRSQQQDDQWQKTDPFPPKPLYDVTIRVQGRYSNFTETWPCLVQDTGILVVPPIYFLIPNPAAKFCFDQDDSILFEVKSKSTQKKKQWEMTAQEFLDISIGLDPETKKFTPLKFDEEFIWSAIRMNSMDIPGSRYFDWPGPPKSEKVHPTESSPYPNTNTSESQHPNSQ